MCREAVDTALEMALPEGVRRGPLEANELEANERIQMVRSTHPSVVLGRGWRRKGGRVKGDGI